MNETNEKTTRLHYLDWLQVLAILGVFLFHAVHPFDDLYGWHIKNAESSVAANFFIGFFAAWGMPFFFLMAGTTSWFSLRRRTPGRYIKERVSRLLFPFILGSFFLTPIQAYFELTHKEWWPAKSFLGFIFSPEARSFFFTRVHPLTLSTRIFGALGYHLWFLGFLFTFALIALPIFLWLKEDSGKRFTNFLAQLTKRRGGLLIFVIPLLLERIVFQPGFPGEQNLADYFFFLLFFVCGYILFSNEHFANAIRRDWLLHLILGTVSTLFFFSSAFGVPVGEWMGSSGTTGFYVSWLLFSINSWSWAMYMLYVGMRFLNYTNKSLQYGREASYPFYFVHQPVIIFIAYYVVHWQVALLIKLLVVVIGSFATTLGSYELLVRRINPVSALFGMKQQKTINN